MVHNVLIHVLLDDKTTGYVAIAAIVLCVVGTVRLAGRLARGSAEGHIHLSSATVQRQQALFNTLVFFALSWAALVPFYNAPKSDNEEIRAFLPAYQGLLFALAGGSLRKYCLMRRGEMNAPTIDTFDKRVLRGLYAVVIALIVGNKHDLFSITFNLPAPLLVGTFFDAIGYYLIVQGSAELTQAEISPLKELKFLGLRLPISKNRLWIWLAATTVLYFVLDLTYAIEGLLRSNHVIHYDPITPFLTWLFALLKLSLCAPFLLIIKREAANLGVARAQIAE